MYRTTACIALALATAACGADTRKLFELPPETVAAMATPCPFGEVLHGGVCVQDVRLDLTGVSLVSSYRAAAGHVVTPSAPFRIFAVFDVTAANLGNRAVGLRWGVYALGASQPSYIPVGEPPATELPATVGVNFAYTGTVTVEVLDDAAMFYDMGLLVDANPRGGQFATRGWGLSRYRQPQLPPPR